MVSMAADWAKIEAEYITDTETSYRKLAQKYGLNQATISQKAKAEDWVSKRKQHASSTQAEILDRDRSAKVDKAAELNDTAMELLKKVKQGIVNAPIVTPSAANNYATALEKLKGVLSIRSNEDIEEQRARIDKLRREADRDDRSASITVTLEGVMDSYGE
jgi:hypothetical protein